MMEICGSVQKQAASISITVSEKNLLNAGLKVKSGLCRVKEKQLFVMDKNKPINKKVKILAKCLSAMPLEEVYIVPAIRETLEKFKSKKEGGKTE